MKKTNESTKTITNFNLLISETSEVEILNLEAMSCVRGGEADGTGSDPIIIKPKI
jgi:hypothetical protein